MQSAKTGRDPFALSYEKAQALARRYATRQDQFDPAFGGIDSQSDPPRPRADPYRHWSTQIQRRHLASDILENQCSASAANDRKLSAQHDVEKGKRKPQESLGMIRRLAIPYYQFPESLLRLNQCRTDRLLEVVEQGQSLGIGKRDQLHQDDAGNFLCRVDPEIGVAQPRPGEAAGAAPTRHLGGRDHKTEPPFLDRPGEEL